MDPEAPAAPVGRSNVTLKLLELEAVKNPELFGSADWSLRLWINGLERWQSEKLKVAEGKKVAVGAEVVTLVHDYTNALELEVKALEHDLTSRDDLAAGKFTLHRTTGFQPKSGEAFVIQGKGAELILHFQVDVTPA